jgi:hypothetical protein
MDTLSSTSADLGTLELHLTDQVGVYNFNALLSILHDLYTGSLFLRIAVAHPPGSAFP